MTQEEFRRQCEAREWVRRYPEGGAAWYAKLAAIERIRGKAAAEQLRQDVREEVRKMRAEAA